MLNIRPCPYCGGEVEVVRIPDIVTYTYKTDKKTGKKEKIEHREKQYRIECKHCRTLVAKGTKFEKETKAEGLERIKQYEAETEKRFAKINCGVWKQTAAAKERDRLAALSSRYDPANDEAVV